MPALITHHLFGEESITALPEGIITTEDERCAFLLANQGPDPFFFRVRTPRTASCTQLGRVMHRSRMSRQLAALRDGVSHLQKHDVGVGRAFVLGLLSHYALDRTAHPFVYAQQWGIQQEDEDLENAGSAVHAVIESDLDVLMLQLKRNGATVDDYPPAGFLVTNDRIDKVAGALMSFVAQRVFGLVVGAQQYGGAVDDMQFAYRLIEPVSSNVAHLISAAEGLVKDYSLLGALAHRVTDEPPRGAGNLDHHTWENPFTEEASSESFPELFDRALGAYADLAARFIAGEDTALITEHINYSGRPLDETEEFDREE